jgi:enoyl-CoA hydratase
MFDNLLIEDLDTTRIITINRPTVLNALNRATVEEIGAAIAALATAPQLRCAIITGAGDKAFVAGADITEFQALSPELARSYSERGHQVLDSIAHARIPVIAAVNGFALGGGLELALACDFILCSDTARLGLVETKLGILPGFGGVARLSRRVGKAMAAEMIFGAGQVKADEALRIGLSNHVHPSAELMNEAKKMAANIAKQGPLAVTAVKRLLREGENCDQRTANTLEQVTFGLVFSSGDKIEGVRAFLEKDKNGPTFPGV